ncbi:unnamed protein product [Zymoseptoria tritici ST99CH_3D1]|nr:unnamed protein product [Zymoseptoria tritici ST99CH_3D1]
MGIEGLGSGFSMPPHAGRKLPTRCQRASDTHPSNKSRQATGERALVKSDRNDRGASRAVREEQPAVIIKVEEDEDGDDKEISVQQAAQAFLSARTQAADLQSAQTGSSDSAWSRRKSATCTHASAVLAGRYLTPTTQLRFRSRTGSSQRRWTRLLASQELVLQDCDSQFSKMPVANPRHRIAHIGGHLSTSISQRLV